MTGLRGQYWAAILMSAAVASCGPVSPGASPPTPDLSPPPPVVELVGARDAADTTVLDATGALRRAREMTLSFRIPGVITRLAVDEGDVVRRGQVLAELDDQAVSARFRQAEAELSHAEADHRRALELLGRGVVSRQHAEVTETQLAASRAAHAGAGFDLRWTRLVAPADGVVLARAAQAGEVIQPGQVVLSIADTASPLVLRAPLPDRDATRLRIGAPAEVTLDALPGEVLPGRVSRIAQRGELQSGAIDFEVTLPERPGLRSGLIARTRLSLDGGAPGAFDRLPAEAVLEAESARAFVMLYDAGRGVVRKTPIRFAGFEGDDALVTGLPQGARVVTAGAAFITDGQRVTVIEPLRGSGR